MSCGCSSCSQGNLCILRQDLRGLPVVSGGGSSLWVETWSLSGSDLFWHLPQLLDQIWIWGIGGQVSSLSRSLGHF